METPILWGTHFVQNILQQRLTTGAIALDGTMGNGHDTLFLAQAVGKQGKVYSFDIQPLAIENTRKRLQEAKLHEQVLLLQDGHENLATHVQEPLDVAMFNLGYLPQGDHQVYTRPETTLVAIKAVLEKLKHKGILSVMIYHGHEGGTEEKEKLLAFLETLSGKAYLVTQTQFLNRGNHPPIILFVEKR